MSSIGKALLSPQEIENIARLTTDSFSVGSRTFDLVNTSTQFILDNCTHKPKIGIICGNGMGDIVDGMTDVKTFPFKDIPAFPISTTEGHRGLVLLGFLEGVPVIVFQGRFHVYEGYPQWKCGFPVRVMKLLGVESLITTNAAGSIEADYCVGDIMLLKDHVNLQGFGGESPMRGANDERFGPRFPPMNNTYDRDLRAHAHNVAREAGFHDIMREGVYVMCGGPMFETPTELLILKKAGIDAVGMSTVPEVMVARHCDLNIFAFSLITNKCIMDCDAVEDTSYEISDVASLRMKEMQTLIRKMVVRMNEL